LGDVLAHNFIEAARESRDYGHTSLSPVSLPAEGNQETGNADQGGDPEAEHPAQELGTEVLERGPKLDALFGDLGSHLGTKLGYLLAQGYAQLRDFLPQLRPQLGQPLLQAKDLIEVTGQSGGYRHTMLEGRRSLLA
jgi:hypothetical protein